jgi:hypothetical protein
VPLFKIVARSATHTIELVLKRGRLPQEARACAVVDGMSLETNGRPAYGYSKRYKPLIIKKR